MTREEIHSEIGNVLKLIEINNNRMFLNDADFELDLELLKNYIVRLYSLQDQLKISEAPKENKVTIDAPTKLRQTEPVVIQASPKPRPNKVVEEVELSPETASKEQPVLVIEPEIQESPIVVVEPQETIIPVEEIIVEPEVQIQPIKTATPSQKFPPKTASTDVYTRFQNTKIDSIKKTISISKRYELQNELFGNSAEAYNDALKTLDNQSSLDQAMEYLEGTLMVNHQWEEDDALVDELRLLLSRRYS